MGLIKGLVETIKGPKQNPLATPNTQHEDPKEVKSIYDSYNKAHAHDVLTTQAASGEARPAPVPQQAEGDTLRTSSLPDPHAGPAPATRSTPRLQPIIALPQVGHGVGVPFLRAYTHTLSDEYEIPEDDFLRFIDGLNTVITPSVEANISKKAINIGSFFIPGVGSLVVGMAGSAVPVIGDKLHLSYGTKHFIATANAQLFNPAGLEATLCSSADLDQFTGVQSHQQYTMTPVERLKSYGSAILHFDELLAPATRDGWHARFGAAVARTSAEKEEEHIKQDLAEGKSQDHADEAEKVFKWLVVKSVGDTGCIDQPQQYLGY